MEKNEPQKTKPIKKFMKIKIKKKEVSNE